MSTQHQQAYCYAQLPQTGLGNMLLVWARALVFAHLNNLPLITSSWTHFNIGPLIRREKRSRLYWNYFNQMGTINFFKRLLLQSTRQIVEEPALVPIASDAIGRKLFIFKKIPHWRDYFGDLREYRNLVRTGIYGMLNRKYYAQLRRMSVPCIAVHVRHGDFRPLEPGEDFARVGHVRTPLSYFCNLIVSIRQAHGSTLPATIFSDGLASDLSELLALPNVYQAESNPDIIDLLLLSKSQFIIVSASSTFSYWAAFLSDAPVLLHPDHIHAPIRPNFVNEVYYEGGARGSIELWPDLLKRNIMDICID